MLKHHLIKSISAETGHSSETIRQILDALRSNVLTAVRKGESVFLFGLGKISVNKRPKKLARNIHTGESVTVPERKVAVFRASTALSDAAKGE